MATLEVIAAHLSFKTGSSIKYFELLKWTEHRKEIQHYTKAILLKYLFKSCRDDSKHQYQSNCC